MSEVVAAADICVIGASAGGLTLAMGAAEMGARVILATAGLPVPAESAERFGGVGVTVLEGAARFTGPDTFAIGERPVQAKRYVIATGSHLSPPALPGLDRVRYLTPETIPAETMEHLIVVGGSAQLVASAQQQARKGAKVTLIEAARLLPQEDPDLIAVLRQALLGDGIDLREGNFVVRVASSAKGVLVDLADSQGGTASLAGSHLLLAGDAVPDIAGLELELAGIAVDKGAVTVDARLRTSNPRVYAIGDSTGAGRGDVWAKYQAGIALKNILFRLPARANAELVPAVILTQPQLARVGWSENVAKAKFRDVRIQQRSFDGGHIKAVLRANGEILGIGIVAPAAAEMLAPWCLALSSRLKLSDLAGMLPPETSCADVSKRLAGDFYAPRLQGEGVRAIVRGLLRFA